MVRSREEYNAYQRDYQRERWKRRKAKYIEMLGGKCAICGGSADLQFDHIKPETKSFTIAKHPTISEKKMLNELAKCRLLCKNCHEKRHSTAKGKHGTVSTYRYCHCELCRAAKAEYSRKWKKKKKAV